MDVYLHRMFVKKFQKLSPKIQEKFEERLDTFLKNPLHPSLHNHSVERIFPSCRSINITGDYRAIYSLDRDTAVFITIGTHSELY